MFGSLRALALELNLWAHGVPATVTRPFPDHEPIATTGIWLTTTTEDMPVGLDSLGHRPELQRREPRRVLALRRADVPTAPRGTAIVAPEKSGDPVKVWRVDVIDRLEADKVHVVVVPDDQATLLLPAPVDPGEDEEP